MLFVAATHCSAEYCLVDRYQNRGRHRIPDWKLRTMALVLASKGPFACKGSLDVCRDSSRRACRRTGVSIHVGANSVLLQMSLGGIGSTSLTTSFINRAEV
jgi:hypothetical protein